jgi:hypothetical protein
MFLEKLYLKLDKTKSKDQLLIIDQQYEDAVIKMKANYIGLKPKVQQRNAGEQ